MGWRLKRFVSSHCGRCSQSIDKLPKITSDRLLPQPMGWQLRFKCLSLSYPHAMVTHTPNHLHYHHSRYPWSCRWSYLRLSSSLFPSLPELSSSALSSSELFSSLSESLSSADKPIFSSDRRPDFSWPSPDLLATTFYLF